MPAADSSSARGPRIALIHAVQVAMEPVERAFTEHWPQAERMNLLEDSLSPDRARDETLRPGLAQRIQALGHYACSAGAQGVLYTCSAFGPAIEAFAASVPVPVLKPNEAMFQAALACGRNLVMLATFRPSIASMEAEFEEAAAASGRVARLRTVYVPDALDALKAGDAERHNALLAHAAQSLGACDAVLLAHFSTSRAHAAVAARTPAPVLTSPASAVLRLRQLLQG